MDPGVLSRRGLYASDSVNDSDVKGRSYQRPRRRGFGPTATEEAGWVHCPVVYTVHCPVVHCPTVQLLSRRDWWISSSGHRWYLRSYLINQAYQRCFRSKFLSVSVCWRAAALIQSSCICTTSVFRQFNLCSDQCRRKLCIVNSMQVNKSYE